MGVLFGAREPWSFPNVPDSSGASQEFSLLVNEVPVQKEQPPEAGVQSPLGVRAKRRAERK